MDMTEKILKGGATMVLAFLVLFLLGAIPGMSGPINTILSAIQSHEAQRESGSTQQLRLLRSICYRLPDNARAPCE